MNQEDIQSSNKIEHEELLELGNLDEYVKKEKLENEHKKDKKFVETKRKKIGRDEIERLLDETQEIESSNIVSNKIKQKNKINENSNNKGSSKRRFTQEDRVEKSQNTISKTPDKQAVKLNSEQELSRDNEFNKLLNTINSEKAVNRVHNVIAIVGINKSGQKNIQVTLPNFNLREVERDDIVIMTEEGFSRMSKKYKDLTRADLKSKEVLKLFDEEIGEDSKLLEFKIPLKRSGIILVTRPNIGDLVISGYENFILKSRLETRRKLNVPDIETVKALMANEHRRSKKFSTKVVDGDKLVGINPLIRVGYMIGKPNKYTASEINDAINALKTEYRFTDYYLYLKSDRFAEIMKSKEINSGTPESKAIAVILMHPSILKHIKGITIPVTVRCQRYLPPDNYDQAEMKENRTMAKKICSWADLGDYYKVTSQEIRSNPNNKARKPMLTLI